MSSVPAETRSFRGIPLPVIAVALAVGATLLGDSMLYAVMPSQPEAWALSIPAVGILLSVNRLVRLVTNSVAAVLFQHFGQRGPFIAALILSVVVTLSYGWITAFTVLLVARMGWGLCWSTLRLGAFWTILTEARDDNRGFLMGAYQAIVRMGSVGGALVGAALTDAFGHRLTLTLFAAVMVATAATWIVSTHARAKREEPQRQRDEGGDLRGVLRDRRLLVTGCGILITGLVFSGLVTASLGFYLSAHFGPRIAILGTAVGVTSATGVLLGVQWSLGLPLAPVLGHLSDRFGRIPIATVGFAVGAVRAARPRARRVGLVDAARSTRRLRRVDGLDRDAQRDGRRPRPTRPTERRRQHLRHLPRPGEFPRTPDRALVRQPRHVARRLRRSGPPAAGGDVALPRGVSQRALPADGPSGRCRRFPSSAVAGCPPYWLCRYLKPSRRRLRDCLTDTTAPESKRGALDQRPGPEYN